MPQRFGGPLSASRSAPRNALPVRCYTAGTFPIYYQEEVLRVIYNGVQWAAPVARPRPVSGNTEPLEDLGAK